MRWTHIAGRSSCATSGVCADGDVVWSWRSDAGVKLAKTLTRLADDGGNQAWSPGRSRISRKAIAQGRPEADSIGRRNTPDTEVAMSTRKKRSTRARLGSLGRPPVAGRAEQELFWRGIAAGFESEDAAVGA